MCNVERKITPRVRRRDRDRTAVVKTELQQTDNAAAAAAQRRYQLVRFNLVSIDGPRHRNAMVPSQRFDPHTPSIVDVAGDHPHGSTWSSRDCGAPKLGRQVLDQEDGDAVVGPPRGKQHILIKRSAHHKTSKSRLCTSNVLGTRMIGDSFYRRGSDSSIPLPCAETR